MKAWFLSKGVDPSYVETHSLYESLSIQQAFENASKPATVTDEEFAEGDAMIRNALKNDPSVRLH